MNKRIISVLTASASILGLTSVAGTARAETNKVKVSDTAELITALENAAAGDEIILAPGTYLQTEWIGEWSVFYSNGEGTKEKPIILRSEDPEKPAVLCGDNQEEKIGLHITGDYWEIYDIKVGEAQKGIILDNSNYSLISGCEVYNTGLEGIHIRDNSSYCVIEDCYVHDNGSYKPGYGEAIYIGSSENTTDYGYDCHYNTVRGCKLGPNTAAEHVDVKEFTIGTVIENCTFDGTGMTGKNYGDSFLEIKGNDVIVRNNVGYRNGNTIMKYAFELYTIDDVWGQNAQLYNNTVYFDESAGALLKGYDCTAYASRNTRIPAGDFYLGNELCDITSGDVNGDKKADTADVKDFNEYIVGASESVPALVSADLVPDGVLNVFDLCRLKKQLGTKEAPQEWGFEKTDSEGAWSIFNGLGGKTVTLTLKGLPGYRATTAYGYWDASAIDPDTGAKGDWINNDSTSFGTKYFDENGEFTVTFTVPDNASNMKFYVYYYAFYDEAKGENIVLGKDEVILESIIIEN